MCGRYVLIADPNLIQQEFNLTSMPDFTARYNIAPTQTLPVVTNENPHELTLLRWGLVPSWSKDDSAAAKMINARSETAAEKPSFRTPFKRRRCLIPASGFYEWQQREGGKAPMFIHLKDREVFGFAGLWDMWRSPDGKELKTFTILTTTANEFTQPIHERMPVILHREDYGLWLANDDVPVAKLQALMKPYDADAMSAYEVSKAVNKVQIDSPECIAPLAS
ncbi:MAG: SOS response-associated peptidase [Anaerolinea sp.]|nr:SOS response-associated peptidase [Anaerolinea sp.]